MWRPWISLMRIMMMAATSRMWMKPPSEKLVMSPNAQRTMRMIAMVINIRLVSSLVVNPLALDLSLSFKHRKAKQVRPRECEW